MVEAEAAVNLDKRCLKAGNWASPPTRTNLYSKRVFDKDNNCRLSEGFLSVDQGSTAHRLTSGPWKQPTKEQSDSWAPLAFVDSDWRETPSLADLVLAEREADEKWFAEIKPVKPTFPIKVRHVIEPIIPITAM